SPDASPRVPPALNVTAPVAAIVPNEALEPAPYAPMDGRAVAPLSATHVVPFPTIKFPSVFASAAIAVKSASTGCASSATVFRLASAASNAALSSGPHVSMEPLGVGVGHP